MRTSRSKQLTGVGVELECVSCHAQRSVELSPRQFKLLSESWKIERECDACRETTEWTFAQAKVGAEEQVDFWDWLATTGEYFEPAGAAPQHERRKERRVDLSVPLRISSREGEEEDVVSENISSSGFCFASSRTYGVGQTVQVTIRPAGEAVPLTQTATIVRASAAADGKILYGARVDRAR